MEIKECPQTNPEELEIVYMVHPQERRRGLMKEVLACLRAEHRAWERTVVATLSLENQASLKALQTWGTSKQEIMEDPATKESMLKVWLSTTAP